MGPTKIFFRGAGLPGLSESHKYIGTMVEYDMIVLSCDSGFHGRRLLGVTKGTNKPNIWSREDLSPIREAFCVVRARCYRGNVNVVVTHGKGRGLRAC